MSLFATWTWFGPCCLPATLALASSLMPMGFLHTDLTILSSSRWSTGGSQ